MKYVISKIENFSTESYLKVLPKLELFIDIITESRTETNMKINMILKILRPLRLNPTFLDPTARNYMGKREILKTSIHNKHEHLNSRIKQRTMLLASGFVVSEE